MKIITQKYASALKKLSVTRRFYINHYRLFVFLGFFVMFSGCEIQSQCNIPNPNPNEFSWLRRENITLKQDVQRALNDVFAKGIIINENIPESLDIDSLEASMETKYILYTLTYNRCYLGDSHSILRQNILLDLCKDLDKISHQKRPSAKTLDHAIWMASKLELVNVISFLIHMGAPANKYELGV